jgi:hypothetical protein
MGAAFAVSFVLRVAAIDRPLNVDEVLWVKRGASFVGALARGNPAATYIRPHPGVMTMWLVGLSNAAACAAEAHGMGASWEACNRFYAGDWMLPLRAYVVPRWVQAFLTAAAMAAFAALAARLFGLHVALLAAALLFLLHLREGGRRWLILSAPIFGLAAATKVPVILMVVPMAAWVILVDRGHWPAFAPQPTRRRAGELALWAAIALGTIVVIWPALWVRPLQTAWRLWSNLRYEVEANAGRMDDSRWDFYARVVAWRLSPVLQAGALAGVARLLWPAWRRHLAGRAEREAIAILAFATLILIRLAGSAGLDRYILPAVPMVAILAGAGWADITRLVGSRAGRPGLTKVLSVAIVAGQAAVLAPHLPGAITFFNPLLGGPAGARAALAMGQGEGLDRAAAWLSERPGAESMLVVANFAPAFAPYFSGRTMGMPPARPVPDRRADAAVVYIRQVQGMATDSAFLAEIRSRPLLHVVTLHGVDYAWIYAGPIVLPEWWQERREPPPPSRSGP